MIIIYNKKSLLKVIKNQKNLGFVPTMGCIHKGHLSLVENSKKKSNKTLVSIYINKPQFNKINDFNKYPRTLRKDIFYLKKAKVDFLYLPREKDIYPSKKIKKIRITPFSKQLCGKFRPNHFVAVVNVLDRFIRIIKPEKIYMGEKDMQQLKIVEHYINKTFENVKLIPCKTIREKNGVAMSSRNKLLSINEMNISSKVYKYIYYNKKKIINNLINIKNLKSLILKFGIKKIDYIKILNINGFIKSNTKKTKYKIFIAYYLGSTRLIDNI
jgi:pantoate--beta-alanine ligase